MRLKTHCEDMPRRNFASCKHHFNFQTVVGAANHQKKYFSVRPI